MTTMQRFDPFQDLQRFRRLLNSPLWAGQRWPGQQTAGQQAAGQQAAGQWWPDPFAPGAPRRRRPSPSLWTCAATTGS